MKKMIKFLINQDEKTIIMWLQNIFIVGVIFIIILASIYIFLIRGNWTKSNILESQLRGNRIAVALEEYFKDHQYYPEKLDDLLSKYIEKLPPPIAGAGEWEYYKPRWDYSKDIDGNIIRTYSAGRTFTLNFRRYRDKHYPYMSYNSRTKTWELVTESF
ncbi:MAG: hypothetical protein NZM04_00505 [Methylacidiphilales bacterium]|nr:hypothetical protein [Candidatus Methylacidiphilales bacterium]